MQTELFAKPQTDTPATKKRCINLDWLEVFAREPIGEKRDADFFRQHGYVVHERAYGTRVYREMFVLDGNDGNALLEVRRDPASKGLSGIHDDNECHIRLVNRTCYFDNAAELLQTFLDGWGYMDVRISRVDICMDFTMFDKGDDPQAFVRRYFRHKYAKINQGRITGHGDDNWSGQEWNSLSWGSKTSAVTTKMYNKTMELFNAKDGTFEKPWIRQAWCLCGLVDDWQQCTKDGEKVNVWRVEFSVRSAVKNWVRIEIDGIEKNYQSIRNRLDCYIGRDKLLVMFASLARHYFRFKKYKQSRRKDRCPDKILFDFAGLQYTYKVGRDDYAAGGCDMVVDTYNRLIEKIKAYQHTHHDKDIYNACEVLIKSMMSDNLRADLANPWSREELLMLRMMVNLRDSDKNLTYTAAMSEIKKLLHITDRTIDIF